MFRSTIFLFILDMIHNFDKKTPDEVNTYDTVSSDLLGEFKKKHTEFTQLPLRFHHNPHHYHHKVNAKNSIKIYTFISIKNL